MEGIYNDIHYKSGWRHLSKEENLDTLNTYLNVEASKKNAETPPKPAEGNEPSVQDDILKKLAKISADIDALHQTVQSQGEKIDNLFGLLEKKEAEGKKSVFGWK